MKHVDASMVNGVDTTLFVGELFKQNEKSKVVVTVSPGRVQVEVDGKLIIDWTGDSSLLTPSGYRTTPNPKAMLLGTYLCRYRFHELTDEPLSVVADEQ